MKLSQCYCKVMVSNVIMIMYYEDGYKPYMLVSTRCLNFLAV